MKISEIHTILSAKQFEEVRHIRDQHHKDFEKYKDLIAKRGSSIHFDIEFDKNFVFSKEHLSQLAQLFIEDVINELELNFIVDNIIASIESYESEEVQVELEGLTDPEINGHITKESVRKLLNDLR